MIHQRSGSHSHDIHRKKDDWEETHNQLLAVQKKSLSVSDPNDASENEADTVAAKVVNGETASVSGTGSQGKIQREVKLSATDDLKEKLRKLMAGEYLDPEERYNVAVELRDAHVNGKIVLNTDEKQVVFDAYNFGPGNKVRAYTKGTNQLYSADEKTTGGKITVRTGDTLTDVAGDKEAKEQNMFAIEYSGTKENTQKMHWLQFGYERANVSIPNGKGGFTYNSLTAPGALTLGDPITYTTDKPNWFLDYKKGAPAPFYDASFPNSKEDDQNTMFDRTGGEGLRADAQKYITDNNLTGNAYKFWFDMYFKTFMVMEQEEEVDIGGGKKEKRTVYTPLFMVTWKVRMRVAAVKNAGQYYYWSSKGGGEEQIGRSAEKSRANEYNMGENPSANVNEELKFQPVQMVAAGPALDVMDASGPISNVPTEFLDIVKKDGYDKFNIK